VTPAEPSPRSSGEDEGEHCGIAGCEEPAARSIARSELRKAYPELEEGSGRLPVCRAHYKTYKKATKSDRALERLGN
jgi:hypothetical protein